MSKKRIVEVETESESEGSALLWGLGGAALGVIAGILVAEKLSGKKIDRGAIVRRLKLLARTLGSRWEPLLGVALEMRDAWLAKRAGKVDESEFEAEEDELDEDAFSALDSALDADDEDEDDADDFDDPDADDVAEEEESEIGRRVLEAFVNDPVLAERSVEIDADDRGRVVLHGNVRTSREVAHAVTIAGGVPGVTDVRQRLSVRLRR
jgi:hypothetical protein